MRIIETVKLVNFHCGMVEWKTIGMGLVVHAWLLYAALDIYYSSPLVHGMQAHGANQVAPAKRLVIFIADGLRAESFFRCNENGSNTAPFLREMSTRGTWGVSTTRVPTETRPGNVALIAGFYEDVSSVSRGWRENPVEFDSIFNQSRYTWSWGSPDVLPMFAKGNAKTHVFFDCYSNDMQEFYESGLPLDNWVFNHFQEFFKSAETNLTLKDMLGQDKIIFCLHLLGIDIIGHSAKPNSISYQEAIENVNKGIEKVYRLINDYYKDNSTAFVFTADHGMTNWGSHGAGSDHETRTPLIAWGAGVRQSHLSTLNQCWPDEETVFIEQADLAPLMSALIGINFPLNSVGVLPLPYLNVSSKQEAWLMTANFKQLLEQMEIQKSSKRQAYWSIIFRDFPQLTDERLKSLLATIHNLFAQKRYGAVVNMCKQWMPVVKSGMTYFHQYERPFLVCCIFFTFLSWLLFIYTYICAPSKQFDFLLTNISSSEAALVALFLFLLCCNSAQPKFYIYLLTPCYFLHNAQWPISTLTKGDTWRSLVVWKEFALGLLFFEMLVAAFHYRYALIVCLAIASLWAFTLEDCRKDVQRAWLVLCIVNSLFLTLPVVGQQPNYNLMLLNCLLLALTSLYLYVSSGKRRWLVLASMQICALLCITFVKLATEHQRTIPAGILLVSWALLLCSFALPLLSRSKVHERLTAISLFLLVPFTLMSVSYEPIFYLTYCCHLYVWILMETGLSASSLSKYSFRQRVLGKNRSTNISMDHARLALFFILFLLLGFFGTGNIASVNSFDPNFVMLFVRVFSPFLMGALLMLKMVIPVLVACSALTTLAMLKGCQLVRLYLVIVFFSDLKALHFFFMLKDNGSWLEIGESISHYVIAMTMIAAIVLLCKVVNWYTSFELSVAEKYLP